MVFSIYLFFIVSICGLTAPCHQSKEYLVSLFIHSPVLITLGLPVSQYILLIQQKDKPAEEDG